jgi:hypothetical protein
MFKKLMFAVVPVLMLAGTTFADDADLAIDASTITDADVNIVDNALDIDVDQLSADAGTNNKTDAVEACFRRCGYSSYGWGGGYNSCYSNYNCYQPYYSYTSYCCARPVYYSSYCCQPTYSYSYSCQPCYTSYWGCY